MSRNILILLLFISRLIPLTGEREGFCQPAVTGQVIDSVALLSDRRESYALYLPLQYETRTSWPVVYFFEPLGRGSLPLQTYKDLAEEKGFILISSNQCRNGAFYLMEPIAWRLFKDTRVKYHIDTTHIYVAGFSGGAKLAFRMALNNPDVGAVIACGAYYPLSDRSEPPFSFHYCGIIGTSDMNYNPMLRHKEDLEKLGVPFFLTLFEGGHTWPPADIFREALYWTMIRDSLNGREVTNELYAVMTEAVYDALDKNVLYNAALRADQMKTLFAATPFGIPSDSLFQQIIRNPHYPGYLKMMNRMAKTETVFQEEIYKAFLGILNTQYNLIDTVHTASWWKGQRRLCLRLMKDKDPEKQKLGKRMEGLIVTSSVEHGEAFMEERDYERSAMAWEIFLLFRPGSCYGFHQLFRCYNGMDQPHKAKKYLARAVKKGCDQNLLQ